MLTNEAVDGGSLCSATFAAGIGVSGLHGVIVVGGRVRSFAVTLAGYLVWYGAQLAVLGIKGYIPLTRPPINEMALARVPEWVSLAVVRPAALIVGRRDPKSGEQGRGKAAPAGASRFASAVRS